MTKKKVYEVPPIAWLKMTDYMHGWLQHELGAAISVGNQRVICVQHLEGARDILMMEAYEDIMKPEKVDKAMCATRKNCLEAGMVLDQDYIRDVYALTPELLKLFIPVECPKMCVTKFGVLRPWTLDTGFSKHQAFELQHLLRQEFWNAVEEFDRRYAQKMKGYKYPAIDMVEAFCAATETPDFYAEAIRREWQRRQKRERERSVKG